VPLDVDLEDRLLYGLTPVRLAYVILAGLAGLAIWSFEWMPAVVRGALAVLAVASGGAMAWSRWRGRAADEWAIDAVRFLLGSHRISWTRRR
jgi:Zn-dependent protease with chaperone function